MTVTALSAHQAGEVVSVLSEAFHEYPVMRLVLGPDGPGPVPYDLRLRRLVELFVSRRAYRSEPMLGVRDDAGVLVGAATVSLPIPRDVSPDFLALEESIWAELGAEARARYEAYSAISHRFASPSPHHYLDMIGVRASHQGRGLARVLLEAVHDLAGADERSAGIMLTTERQQNVAMYERFGYRVEGHTRVTPALESWAMFRAGPARPR